MGRIAGDVPDDVGEGTGPIELEWDGPLARPYLGRPAAPEDPGLMETAKPGGDVLSDHWVAVADQDHDPQATSVLPDMPDLGQDVGMAGYAELATQDVEGDAGDSRGFLGSGWRSVPDDGLDGPRSRGRFRRGAVLVLSGLVAVGVITGTALMLSDPPTTPRSAPCAKPGSCVPGEEQDLTLDEPSPETEPVPESVIETDPAASASPGDEADEEPDTSAGSGDAGSTEPPRPRPSREAEATAQPEPRRDASFTDGTEVEQDGSSAVPQTDKPVAPKTQPPAPPPAESKPVEPKPVEPKPTEQSRPGGLLDWLF